MIKRTLFSFMGIALLFATLVGCSSEESYPVVDGNAPSITASSEIMCQPGRDFTISATIEDADGISHIDLYCPEIYLEKTINLLDIYDELLTSYDLAYTFSLASTQEDDNLDLVLTVTDVLGKTTSQTLNLNLNGDFDAPVFTTAPGSSVTVLIKTDTYYNLKFTATDNVGIDYAELAIAEIGYSETVDGESKTSLEVSEIISLPSEAQEYTLSIKVYDAAGLSVEQECIISVSEMPDFTKMYLADVATAAELNSDVMGVPMLIERTDEFTYRGRYYCAVANQEIYFLPQKTDFSPICFGIDPYDSTKITDDPDLAEPFILTEKGVYYEIIFNISEGTYSMSTYTVDEATDQIVQEIGSDYYLDASQPEYIIPFKMGILGTLPGINSWSPSSIIEIVQDPDNKHIYTCDLTLEAGYQLNFIIHNEHSWGWWDYCFYRFDSSDEPEVCLFKDGNSAQPVAPAAGNYKFWFDAHLERAKIYLVD